MKLLRATAHVDEDVAPAFFNLLAHSEAVEEARLLEVNTTLEGIETQLFAIDGDPSGFEAGVAGTPGVESVEVSRVAPERAVAMLVIRPLEMPLFSAIHSGTPASGLVLRTPIVYADGTMRGRAVGDPEQLQRGIEDVPEGMDVRIEEIGTYRGTRDDPTTALSERQREALATAVALGYYDQPRGATHADVAAELGCAPQTASDHLQKAEATVMEAVVDGDAPGF